MGNSVHNNHKPWCLPPLCIWSFLTQKQPPLKDTCLVRYLEATLTILSAMHLALGLMVLPHSSAHPYTRNIPSKEQRVPDLL